MSEGPRPDREQPNGRQAGGPEPGWKAAITLNQPMQEWYDGPRQNSRGRVDNVLDRLA